MYNLAQQIKSARLQHKLSQGRLASLTELSLATIQNIESGRANPAWDTLQALFNILRIQIDVSTRDIDWSELSTLGCPLLDRPSLEAVASRENLLRTLQSAANQLKRVRTDSRNEKALQAWLIAIRDHYPQLWESLDPEINQWLIQLREPVSIRLRRLALAKLATYL